MLPDKKNISTAFSAKAGSYDKYGIVQNRIAKRLSSIIAANIPCAGKMLDIGCGTGNSALFSSDKIDVENLLLMDISFNSLIISKKRINGCICVCGDIELPPFKKDSIDLITVSSSMQWIKNVGYAVNTACELLKPSGYFAFSVMLDGSMENLRTIQKKHGILPPVDFIDKEKFLDILDKCGLSLLFFETSEEKDYFFSGKSLLKSLSGLGSTSHKGKRLNPSALKKFCRDLEKKNKNTDKLELNYNILYGVTKKASLR